MTPLGWLGRKTSTQKTKQKKKKNKQKKKKKKKTQKKQQQKNKKKNKQKQWLPHNIWMDRKGAQMFAYDIRIFFPTRIICFIDETKTIIVLTTIDYNMH